MTSALSHLLLTNPSDTRSCLVAYFVAVDLGQPTPSKSSFIEEVGGGVDPLAAEKRAQILKDSGGLLAKLASMCVAERPQNVARFMVDKLESLEEADRG